MTSNSGQASILGVIHGDTFAAIQGVFALAVDDAAATIRIRLYIAIANCRLAKHRATTRHRERCNQ